MPFDYDERTRFLKDLFQTEFAKMVAVISRLFGLQHIELAEDIVSETFLQASETWGIKGIPKNPTAWLYAVAKQKTLYHFRRDKIFNEKVVPRLSRQHEKSNTIGELNFRNSILRIVSCKCFLLFVHLPSPVRRR